MRNTLIVAAATIAVVSFADARDAGLGDAFASAQDAGAPLPMGQLDKEAIRSVIQARRSDVRACFEGELLKRPTAGGKVAVRFVVAATGSVSQADVEMSNTNSPELDLCVVQRLSTWKFPRPSGGGVVEVTYPFFFNNPGR